MSSPEIKQSFIALSAFSRLDHPASVEEVIQSMDEIAKETGAASFNSIGDYTSDIALEEFTNGSLVRINSKKKMELTRSGERLRIFQARYIKKYSPDFPKI